MFERRQTAYQGGARAGHHLAQSLRFAPGHLFGGRVPSSLAVGRMAAPHVGTVGWTKLQTGLAAQRPQQQPAELWLDAPHWAMMAGVR